MVVLFIERVTVGCGWCYSGVFRLGLGSWLGGRWREVVVVVVVLVVVATEVVVGSCVGGGVVGDVGILCHIVSVGVEVGLISKFTFVLHMPIHSQGTVERYSLLFGTMRIFKLGH